MGLGYFGGRWLGSTWFGTAVSVLALFVAGALAAFVVKRPSTRTATTAEAEAEATETAPPTTATVVSVPAPTSASGATSPGGSATLVESGPVSAPAPAAP